MRTNSPISDPEPDYTTEVAPPPVDPADNETVAFRNDKKYSKVLDKLRARQEALRQEVAIKPDSMTYEAFGMKAEINARVIQELDNFINDVELTYGLQKQQK